MDFLKLKVEAKPEILSKKSNHRKRLKLESIKNVGATPSRQKPTRRKAVVPRLSSSCRLYNLLSLVKTQDQSSLVLDDPLVIYFGLRLPH